MVLQNLVLYLHLSEVSEIFPPSCLRNQTPRSVNQIDVQSSGLFFDPVRKTLDGNNTTTLGKRESWSTTVGHMIDVILQTADGRLQLQC